MPLVKIYKPYRLGEVVSLSVTFKKYFEAYILFK
jgi:hypothetical protein